MINFFEFTKLINMFALLALLAVPHAVFASGYTSASACGEQSEAKQPCPFELPKEAINKLKIDAGFGWGIFNGSIYNGNNEYIITQLVVSMTPIHDHHHTKMTDNMSHKPRIHYINMNLKPLAKGALSMALDDDVVHVHDFKWEVIKAFGHNVH